MREIRERRLKILRFYYKIQHFDFQSIRLKKIKEKVKKTFLRAENEIVMEKVNFQ